MSAIWFLAEWALVSFWSLQRRRQSPLHLR